MPTQTDLKTTRPGTNGSASRKCHSWIESFVEYTENLDSPIIYRKWAAITTIAAALEQRVWLQTSEPLYPNLYTFIIGPPGIGKTRAIMRARKFLSELPEFHIAPTSILMASLVDCLMDAKRVIINHPNPPLEFNSMTLVVDEFGAFMHSYDEEIVSGLTTFYDVVVPYSQHRRGKDLKIKIKHPQLTILAGSTPVDLIRILPEHVWEQGFCSRIMLIYAAVGKFRDDIFALKSGDLPAEMVSDLRQINSLIGEFTVTPLYAAAINNWRKLGQPPVPDHPKLLHYNTRRLAHLFKLTMIASVDRSDDLTLSVADFNKALGWLLEAESYMPEVFRTGSVGADSKVMDETLHFVKLHSINGAGVNEKLVVKFIRERVPVHAVMRIVEVMERSGMIKMEIADHRTGLRTFIALD